MARLIDDRVQELENSHNLLVQDIRSINKTLSKIEVSIEKMNNTLNKFLVIEERVHTNSDRLNKLEDAQSKALWYIATTFISGLVAFVYGQSR